MRKLFPLFISLLVLLSCNSNNEPLESDSISNMFPGIYLSGETKIYVDENGNPVTGDFDSHYENGELRSELTFEDGFIVSGSGWDEEGELRAVYSIEDELPIVTYLSENGQKNSQFQFKDDMITPVATKVWYQDGTLNIESTQSHYKTWYENGQPESEVILTDGKMEGTGYGWHENGELAAENHYKDDQWHGTFKRWDENGNLIEEKTYDMGMPQGTHTTWDSDGNIIEEIEYDDGKPLAIHKN